MKFDDDDGINVLEGEEQPAAASDYAVGEDFSYGNGDRTGRGRGGGNDDNDNATPPPPPPPAPGSGLVQACTLVKSILDQVTLNDCPPDNEDDGEGGVASAAGAANVIGGRMHVHAPHLPKSPSVGHGHGHGHRHHHHHHHRPPSVSQRQLVTKGFSRQRHVVPTSHQAHQAHQPMASATPRNDASSSGGSARYHHRTPAPISTSRVIGGGNNAAGNSSSGIGRARMLTSPTASTAATPSSMGTLVPTATPTNHVIAQSYSNGSSGASGPVASPLSVEDCDHSNRGDNGGGGGGDIVPARTWESVQSTDEDVEGTFLALIRLKSSDSQDNADDCGGGYGSGGYGGTPSGSPSAAAGKAPGLKESVDAGIDEAHPSASSSRSVRGEEAAGPPTPAIVVPPASATTAPLLVNYSSASSGGAGASAGTPTVAAAPPGPYSAAALRKTESRMGTVSLAALCARTLDTVAAVGENASKAEGAAVAADEDGTDGTPKRSGGDRKRLDASTDENVKDDESDYDEDDIDVALPPSLNRKKGAGDGANDLLDDCVNTIFQSNTDGDDSAGAKARTEKEDEAGSPPINVVATTDVQTPPSTMSPRRMLRMFGSEYARHLSSTPFSPPALEVLPAGCGVGVGPAPAVAVAAAVVVVVLAPSSQANRDHPRSRTDWTSSPDRRLRQRHRLPVRPYQRRPALQSTVALDDSSPFSPESPMALVQTDSNLSSISGLTSHRNQSRRGHMHHNSRPPIGASTLPRDPYAIENQSPDVLTGAMTDIVVTVGNERPPKGYYRISQSSSGLDLSKMKRAKTGKTSSAKSGKSALTQLSRKPVALYLNVKKEPNWDRAVQRPCVTAITVIYPDRNEFVPPGFCVVRRYKGGAKGDDGSQRRGW